MLAVGLFTISQTVVVEKTAFTITRENQENEYIIRQVNSFLLPGVLSERSLKSKQLHNQGSRRWHLPLPSPEIDSQGAWCEAYTFIGAAPSTISPIRLNTNTFPPKPHLRATNQR